MLIDLNNKDDVKGRIISLIINVWVINTIGEIFWIVDMIKQLKNDINENVWGTHICIGTSPNFVVILIIKI